MIPSNYFDMFSDDYYETIGAASHELKNIISFLSSSYQLISLQHPEVSNFDFWSEMGTAIDDMIKFMEETSQCRYCLRPELSSLSINEILYSLPDETDELYPDSDRHFDFHIDRREMFVTGDATQLTRAFREITANCYDATSDGDTIIISATPDANNSHVTITITNNGYFPKIDFHKPGTSEHTIHPSTDASILCKPFYTTKTKHFGTGLTIASLTFHMHNGNLTFQQFEDKSSVCITLPLIAVK